MRARTGWQLAALCTVPFIMVLGNSMLIPVLPAMREALQIGRAQAGLTITFFSIPAGIAIVLAGYLSDRYGRKVVIVPSLVVYALGGAVSFAAAVWLKEGAFPLILAGRIIQGIGAAGTAPVAMAMTGDIFQSAERTKALGLLEASNGLGKVVSPILGSAIGLLGWSAVFAGYTALTIPAAALVWFFTREPKGQHVDTPPGEYLRSVRSLLRRKARSFAAAFLAGTVILFILFGVLFYLSETLEAKYRLDGIPKGGVLAVPVLALSVTSYLTGSRLQHAQRWLKPAVVTGMALGGAGMLLTPLLGGARPDRGPGDWVFFGGMVVLGIGGGLVLPALNTLVTSSAAEDERGMLTALYSATRFFGVALGPPLFGLLMGAGRPVPFLFSAACLGGAAAVALFFLSPAQLMGRAAEGKWDPAGQTRPAGPAQPEQPVAAWRPPGEREHPAADPARRPVR